MDHVHERKIMRLQLERVDVHLNLAVGSAKGLGDGSAFDVGNLVADGKLRQILEAGFIQSLALQGYQADRLVRGVHAEHHRRQRSWRQPPQVGHRQVGDIAERGIGVGTWPKVNLDKTHAGERPRFNVIDIVAQGKETFKRIGDVRFDLFRRHPGIKGGDHYNGKVDRGKKVYRHVDNADHAYQGDHPGRA